MKHRKLQIAWSVAWGVVAVLLVVLWVRSYWRRDTIQRIPREGYWMYLASSVGDISFKRHKMLEINEDIAPDKPLWYFDSQPLIEYRRAFPTRIFKRFYYDGYGHYDMPQWFPVSLALLFAAAPWLRWRFSLRTLLIATTLVAVVLGIIVWMSRAS